MMLTPYALAAPATMTGETLRDRIAIKVYVSLCGAYTQRCWNLGDIAADAPHRAYVLADAFIKYSNERAPRGSEKKSDSP